MRTVGIICEYNPFHTGHKRQIDILRSMGYDCIICVMSGNFVQRGELAIFDKYTRAEAAIGGGADVVIELPFPFSSFSAEGFADAGVYILSSLGVDAISFGSESGDIAALERSARAVLSSDFVSLYNELQRGGLGSAAAYFEAIRQISGEDASILSNDILGISYVSAIKKLGATLDIIPIRREGTAYNDKTLQNGTLPSASAIRESMVRSEDTIRHIFDGFVPDPAIPIFENAVERGAAPVSLENIGAEILSFFKLMTPNEITARAVLRSGGGKHIAEDGCGILERICKIAASARDLDEFFRGCYNSKYTNARINRVILFSLLAVSDKLTTAHPEYVNLLAASLTGRNFLSKARKSCEFPIITKPADAPSFSLQRKISEAADAFYSSAFPKNLGNDHFIKARPFIQK